MMNRDDIIRMAREAGFDSHDMSDDFTVNLEDIERFAELVADAARGDYHEGWEEGYSAGYDSGWDSAMEECVEIVGKAEPFTAVDLIEARRRGDAA